MKSPSIKVPGVAQFFLGGLLLSVLLVMGALNGNWSSLQTAGYDGTVTLQTKCPSKRTDPQGSAACKAAKKELRAEIRAEAKRDTAEAREIAKEQKAKIKAALKVERAQRKAAGIKGPVPCNASCQYKAWNNGLSQPKTNTEPQYQPTKGTKKHPSHPKKCGFVCRIVKHFHL